MITRGHKHHPKWMQVLTHANLLVLWKHETFRNEMFANWLLPESYFLVTALTCTTGILRLCAPAANYVVSFFFAFAPSDDTVAPTIFSPWDDNTAACRDKRRATPLHFHTRAHSNPLPLNHTLFDHPTDTHKLPVVSAYLVASRLLTSKRRRS